MIAYTTDILLPPSSQCLIEAARSVERDEFHQVLNFPTLPNRRPGADLT